MCIHLVVSNLHHQQYFRIGKRKVSKFQKNLDGKYKFPIFDPISFDKSDLESYPITYLFQMASDQSIFLEVWTLVDILT